MPALSKCIESFTLRCHIHNVKRRHYSKKKVTKEYLSGTLSEQIAHSTVDLHLKEISEFIHGSVMNKDKTSHDPFKSYTGIIRSTYTHKIRPLRIWPIGPIASESVI